MNAKNMFDKGDRVELTEEGLEQFPKTPSTGVVVGYSHRKDCIQILRDDRKCRGTYWVGFWQKEGVGKQMASFPGITIRVTEYEALKRCKKALQEFAEYDCGYGDNCPTHGSKHGQCIGCKAREALSGSD